MTTPLPPLVPSRQVLLSSSPLKAESRAEGRVPHVQKDSEVEVKAEQRPLTGSGYCLSLDTVIAADGLFKRSEPEIFSRTDVFI